MSSLERSWLDQSPDLGYRKHVTSLTIVLAAAVRSRRAALEWQQADIAEKMGWSQQTTSLAERGRRTFTADDVLRLAEVFETTVDKLLRDAPEDIRARFGFPNS